MYDKGISIEKWLSKGQGDMDLDQKIIFGLISVMHQAFNESYIYLLKLPLDDQYFTLPNNNVNKSKFVSVIFNSLATNKRNREQLESDIYILNRDNIVDKKVREIDYYQLDAVPITKEVILLKIDQSA